MTSRMSEFREFVSLHPLIRDEVKNGKRTWQNIYEEWVLYGEGDELWGKFKEKMEDKENMQTGSLKDMFNMDKVKNVLGYVKKIDPEQLNRTLNNVQKVIQIVQTVGGAKSVNVSQASAFADWWD